MYLLFDRSDMRTQVRKIGNSLGNIIPATFIRQLQLEEGSEIEMNIENGKIIIEPVYREYQSFPFSEAELLNGMTAHSAHADEVAVISAKESGD